MDFQQPDPPVYRRCLKQWLAPSKSTNSRMKWSEKRMKAWAVYFSRGSKDLRNGKKICTQWIITRPFRSEEITCINKANAILGWAAYALRTRRNYWKSVDQNLQQSCLRIGHLLIRYWRWIGNINEIKRSQRFRKLRNLFGPFYASRPSSRNVLSRI